MGLLDGTAVQLSEQETFLLEALKVVMRRIKSQAIAWKANISADLQSAVPRYGQWRPKDKLFFEGQPVMVVEIVSSTEAYCVDLEGGNPPGAGSASGDKGGGPRGPPQQQNSPAGKTKINVYDQQEQERRGGSGAASGGGEDSPGRSKQARVLPLERIRRFDSAWLPQFGHFAELEDLRQALALIVDIVDREERELFGQLDNSKRGPGEEGR